MQNDQRADNVYVKKWLNLFDEKPHEAFHKLLLHKVDLGCLNKYFSTYDIYLIFKDSNIERMVVLDEVLKEWIKTYVLVANDEFKKLRPRKIGDTISNVLWLIKRLKLEGAADFADNNFIAIRDKVVEIDRECGIIYTPEYADKTLGCLIERNRH